MDPVPIKFVKSFEDRIAEYKRIFSHRDFLSASDVWKEWSYNAQIAMEPCGWQAIWKISRRKCKDLDVTFPAAVYVMVQGIDTEALTAKVNVLENPSGLDIPELQEASLVNLYPTVNQNYKLEYIDETADFLDKLRLFYDFLWQPWDLEDDEKEDWLSAHLESRLRLYYDLQSGKIPPDMAKHIQQLYQEAKSLNYSIEALESEVDDKEDVEPAVLCSLMDLHTRMDTIKNEFERYENPHLRSLLLMKKLHGRQSLAKSMQSEYHNTVWVIWPGGVVDAYIEVLKACKYHISGDAFVRTSSKLQDVLDVVESGGVILISSGNHGIVGLGEFEKGGTIKGILTPETTTLVPCGAGNVLLNCIGGEITLENLTVDAHQLQIAIACRDTALRLKNCHIVGLSGGSTSEGLLALNSAKIVLDNCHISGFGTGLVVQSRAEVSLVSCKITSCHTGIMVFDGGKLSLEKCTVSDCTEYGIKVEICKQSLCVDKVGSIGLLNGVGEVAVRDSSVHNNSKGDVCVIQTHVDAGYDSDSPTFSFLLSSDNQHSSFIFDEVEQPQQLNKLSEGCEETVVPASERKNQEKETELIQHLATCISSHSTVSSSVTN